MVDLNQIVIRLSSNAYPDDISTETVFQNSLLFAQMDAPLLPALMSPGPRQQELPVPLRVFPA